MAGLWDNIHAKRKRIKSGSGEKMRKPGDPGAPTAEALKRSAKAMGGYTEKAMGGYTEKAMGGYTERWKKARGG